MFQTLEMDISSKINVIFFFEADFQPDDFERR